MAGPEIKLFSDEILKGIAEMGTKDFWLFRMIIGALGLVALLAMIGAIILAMSGKAIPDLLTALGSAAIGALAGLLAPSPASK